MNMSYLGLKKKELEQTDAPLPQTLAPRVKNSINYTYEEAILTKWKTIKDINAWIAQHFNYDLDRALELADHSETREISNIYTPTQTFDAKKGICVDLARFAVETIQAVDPSINVKYLMIEFEPIRIGNRVLKRHWMVVYKENNQLYTMADTKYPGFIDGPYSDISEFVMEYQKIRKRKIKSYSMLDTYKKTLKSPKRMKRMKQL